VLLAVAALMTIGTAEAIASNAQLALLPGRAQPAPSASGALLTVAGIALSVAVYAALGIVLARGDADEAAALRTGMTVGLGAGLFGGAIRAYLIGDYLGGVLARFGLGDFLSWTLAVFVALAVAVSVAAGAGLTWLSFRSWRRRPRSRPPR
jgi:hypothetical protein